MKLVICAIFGLVVLSNTAAYAGDCSEMGYEPFLNATTAKQDVNDVKSDKTKLTKSDSEKIKDNLILKKNEQRLLSYAID